MSNNQMAALKTIAAQAVTHILKTTQVVSHYFPQIPKAPELCSCFHEN